jgi:hypothetical protein
MSASVSLGFYRDTSLSYKAAKEAGSLYSVQLTYAEAHKGLNQTAVYDALDIIAEVKSCYGLSEQRLKFVLLDEKDNLIDAG